MKKVFWIVVITVVIYLGFKVGPIYYKAFMIRGICQHHADIYHRYNKTYIYKRLEEKLSALGIPKSQREYSLEATDDSVILEIYYRDTANFLDRYTKNFEFRHKCEGVLESVVQ